VSGRKDPARALVGTGIPHLGKGDHALYHQKLAQVIRATRRRAPLGRRRARSRLRGRRPLRCLLRVRAGSRGTSPPAILLVREAGASISDTSGKPYQLGGPSLLATNAHLLDTMVEILG
jgi:myo-inositol-1(or 4)-monophosphatase